MKQLAKYLYYEKLNKISPFLYYLIEYARAAKKVKGTYNLPGNSTRQDLFNNFLIQSEGKKCLQIGVKEEIGEKFGPNWVSVDKYDTRDFIDYNYDIHTLEFEDESFDAVVCWSILEHIPHPEIAIKELYRVLKPDGEVWVQLPFLFPYHEVPKDYWRVTPDGLRVWMDAFKEISCGCDFWAKTSIISAVYYHGSK
ncbi:MAG: class I SAM-dependent methyltransferase [Spirulina sp. SIO3F2]|nr:class I SAM-dependent methyltransferase [Spirulina sp. SIO3F2]